MTFGIPKIQTDFWLKPIPYRGADWQAWYEGDEPDDDGNMPHGNGATETAAIADLIENHPRDAA